VTATVMVVGDVAGLRKSARESLDLGDEEEPDSLEMGEKKSVIQNQTPKQTTTNLASFLLAV
jgi:hypothetical protein